MGRNVYLTDKELTALRDTSSEWCDMMGSGDEQSCNAVDERLTEGLGSALKKLYKGLNGERAYKDYENLRKENYGNIKLYDNDRFI